MKLFEDVVYGEHERHRVDIALPDNCSGVTGLVFFIHGGGWTNLGKEIHREDLSLWTEEGFVAAATNYRYVSPDVTFTGILDDITVSLGKVKQFAAEKGVILEKALFSGASAGGHLSLLYAYTRAEESPVQPVAVAEYYGPTDFTTRDFYMEGETRTWLEDVVSLGIGARLTEKNFDSEPIQALLKADSPLHHVSPKCVPTLMIHGQEDKLVRFEQSVAMEKALREQGVKAELWAMPHSGHGYDAPEDADLLRQAKEVFRQYALEYLK